MNHILTFPSKTHSAFKDLSTGAVAGLAGGLVYGLLLGMAGLLPGIGMLIGQDNALAGFTIHMGISGLIGMVYGLIAKRLPLRLSTAFFAGLVYGIAWWVLAELILMPLLLGAPQVLSGIGLPQIFTLIGRVFYGEITVMAFTIISANMRVVVRPCCTREEIYTLPNQTQIVDEKTHIEF
ncbi:MAG: hypothetical protein A2Z49_04880 [Chloroflexi bacterium RBG_19FT_COMBO_56_12]|nr:MAG: hypothetical protein A2Z49_04880 [Chloroflexi bacterium RBG_19FT_COMBO_56_12]